MKKILFVLCLCALIPTFSYSAYDESVVLGRSSSTNGPNYLKYIPGTGPNDVIWALVINSTWSGATPTIGFYNSQGSTANFISSITVSGTFSRDIQLGIRVSSGITYSTIYPMPVNAITIIYKKTGR